MRVLQFTKRCVTLLAAGCIALSGCGDSGPEAPFNPGGTSDDIASLNATFESPTFASFAWFSPQFNAALSGSPLVAASASAFDLRQASTGRELRAAAVRSAQRLSELLPQVANGSFSASVAAIPAEIAGRTFEYIDGSYVATDRTGAPSNGVRFILYAVDPVTFLPAEPLVETGYVQLTDLSGSLTQAARVIVVSGETTYLDYTVSVSANTTSGQIVVSGFVTDGTNRANISLRSTVTSDAGLTLVYTVDVPQRDVSISLTMTATGLDQESGTIEISLAMSGPNGTVSMVGSFTQAGGTITVRVNGDHYATITASGAEPAITGADGQPLTDQDAEALEGIYQLTGEAFTSFDAMIMPVGAFMQPAT
jgi:hypothetical protein